MCCADDLGDSSWYYQLSSLWEYKGQPFQQVEAEAIACVQFYVESLYKAISIQCESYRKKCVTDKLFSELSCFGFDLTTALLQAATVGKQGRDHVRMWPHSLFDRNQERPPTVSDTDCKDCIFGYNPLFKTDKHRCSTPLDFHRRCNATCIDERRGPFSMIYDFTRPASSSFALRMPTGLVQRGSATCTTDRLMNTRTTHKCNWSIQRHHSCKGPVL